MDSLVSEQTRIIPPTLPSTSGKIVTPTLPAARHRGIRKHELPATLPRLPDERWSDYLTRRNAHYTERDTARDLRDLALRRYGLAIPATVPS